MTRISNTLATLVILFVSPAFAEQTNPQSFAPVFYAFENGVSFGSAENNAKTLRELGYDGISQAHVGGEKLAHQVAAFDKAGLRVLSVYLNVGDTPLAEDLVKPLANRDGGGGTLLGLLRRLRGRPPAPGPGRLKRERAL